MALFASDPDFSAEVVDKAVAHLWNVLLNTQDGIVTKQACEALGLFPLEAISNGMPEPYKPQTKDGICMMYGEFTKNVCKSLMVRLLNCL